MNTRITRTRIRIIDLIFSACIFVSRSGSLASQSITTFAPSRKYWHTYVNLSKRSKLLENYDDVSKRSTIPYLSYFQANRISLYKVLEYRTKLCKVKSQFTRIQPSCNSFIITCNRCKQRPCYFSFNAKYINDKYRICFVLSMSKIKKIC